MNDGANPSVETALTLRVLPAPTISIEKLESGRLHVVWNRGALLQSNRIDGPYVAVPDAVSPLEIEASEDSRFFQIRIR